MNNRKRYKLNEYHRSVFYQTPKFLFLGELKKLSNDARILYSVLKDRHELSAKNQWTNENDEIYIIFSRNEMSDVLGVSENTVLKSINTLKNYNLIEEERVGLGKPNRIFLLEVETPEISGGTPENTQTRKICGSEPAKFADQNPQNLRISHYKNKTNFNNTYVSDIKSSPSDSASPATVASVATAQDGEEMTGQDATRQYTPTEKEILDEKKRLLLEANRTAPKASGSKEKPPIEYDYDYTTMKAKIQANISYSFFTQYRQQDIKRVDEIVECMLDVICSSGNTVKIGGEHKNRQMVIDKYLQVNNADIAYILDSFASQKHTIKNVKGYLKVCLLNVKDESEHIDVNQVASYHEVPTYQKSDYSESESMEIYNNNLKVYLAVRSTSEENESEQSGVNEASAL
jgi:hypothetical protein